MNNVRLISTEDELNSVYQDENGLTPIYFYGDSYPDTPIDIPLAVCGERGNDLIAVLCIGDLRDSLGAVKGRMLAKVRELRAVANDLSDAVDFLDALDPAALETHARIMRRKRLERDALQKGAGREAAERAQVEAVSNMSDEELAAFAASHKVATFDDDIPF